MPSRTLASMVLAPLLVVSACSAVPAPTGHASSPTPSTAAATSTAPASTLSVTSTLDGRTSLPARILWEVTPIVTGTATVKSVEFFIDDQLAWRENNPPYDYSDDGGRLVTTFLPAGPHTFRAVATLTDGTTGTDQITATMATPPAIPKAWRNVTWSRKISGGDPSADGTWTITAQPYGWHISDPQGGGANQDLDWTSPTRITIRAYLNEPVLGQYQYGGAFCEEPDPAHVYRYRINPTRTTLTLTPNGTDPCQGRAFILTGTWQRT